jgi:glucose/arabinose dehydrogenase
VDTVATNLEVPWSLDFAPDGRVFVTERIGRVRIIQNGVLGAEPWAQLPVFARDEQLMPESGLMGIAIAPDFDESGHVFVMGTFWKRDQSGLSGKLDKLIRRVGGAFSPRMSIPYENRVYRLKDRAGFGADAELIIDNLPANYYHAGGALGFGPDGMLYVSVGEALGSQHSTEIEKASGKILRYLPDGSVPRDNPVAGSPVYATGLRNPQALAWHPQLGVLLSTDHGPSFLPHEGGRSGSDELNVIAPGASFGWPKVAGKAGNSRYSDPLIEWTPAIAPAGLAFYTGEHTPWRGSAFVSGLRGRQLRRIVFDSTAATRGQLKVAGEEVLFSNSFGRVRAVRMGPDGWLWITTSNRDGRGQPATADDLVLRIRPASTENVANDIAAQ